MKIKPFFEPGPLEEYIARLSSCEIQPNPTVWSSLNSSLNSINHKRKIRRLTFAGFTTFSILFTSLFLSNLWIKPLQIAPYSANMQIIPLYSPPELPNHKIVSAYIKTKDTPLANTEIKKNRAQPPLTLLVPPPISDEEVVIEQQILEPEEVNPNEPNQPAISNGVINNYNPFNSEYVHIPYKRKEKNTWSLIGYLNPAFAPNLTDASGYTYTMNHMDIANFGGDVLFKKEMGENFALYSGISISPLGQNVNNLILLKDQENKQMKKIKQNNPFNEFSAIHTCNDIIADFSAKHKEDQEPNTDIASESYQIQQRFYYVQLPLIFSSNYKTQYFNFELKMGMATGILINNKFEAFYFNGYESERSVEERRLNLSALMAVSISYPITPRIDFIVEPNIQWYFNPLSKTHKVNYPKTSSIKLGVGYNF